MRINALRERISQVLSPHVVNAGAKITLIDPPDHPNVGDNAIFLGEMAFLGKVASRTRVDLFDWRTFSNAAVPFVEQSSLILIHGGGNFGDIWPEHHGVRMQVLEAFKHKKIVQLPQSIHFDSGDELNRTARAIAACADFTLLVRDERSLEKARQFFDCRTELCPDMAFAMDDIVRGSPASDVFALLRSDKEVAADHREIVEGLKRSEASFEVGDWLEEPWTMPLVFDKAARKLVKRAPALADFANRAGSMVTKARVAYAEYHLRKGIELLSRGRVVVTDRLHAHILSYLLGIPSIVFDSYDGKISALHDTWTKQGTATQLVASVDDLERTLSEWVRK